MNHHMALKYWVRRGLAWVLFMEMTFIFSGQVVVDRAVAFGQAGNWDQALEILLPEMGNTSIQSDPHAWYVLGFIQKELYKTMEAHDTDSPRRLEAVSSLQKAAGLKPSTGDEQKITAALDFLARSFLRDAIDRVDGFTVGSDSEILDIFGRYEAIAKSINPNADVSEQKADVYRYLGQANGLILRGLTEDKDGLEEQLFERSVDHYEYALKLIPGDYSGLYNLAITLYNHGVRQLKRINHETSMFELMEIQDACVALFEESLTPMESAHQLQPNRFETLKGLMTIHYALNQSDESDRYREEIDRLNRNRP
jgi:tetratricopeptide (TPR) repeat protein